MLFAIVPCDADVEDRAADPHCACAGAGQSRVQDKSKNVRLYVHDIQSKEREAIDVVEGVLLVPGRNVEEEVPKTDYDHEEEHNTTDSTRHAGIHLVVL